MARPGLRYVCVDVWQWPEQTVDDIDAQLNENLKRLERETIDVLLSWETTHRDGGASLSTSIADGPEGSEGYLSTLQVSGPASEEG